jgi:hypothetical protein
MYTTESGDVPAPQRVVISTLKKPKTARLSRANRMSIFDVNDDDRECS